MTSNCAIHADTETADGIHLCQTCTNQLEQDLSEVDSVWEDLQTTIARLDKGASSIGGGPAGSCPPVNLDALDKGQTLRVVLGGWASCLPVLTAAGEPPRLASHLLSHLRIVVGQEWVGDLAMELRDALNACRLATDRAAERVTLGPCGSTDDGAGCPGVLSMRQGERIARCRTCGATIDARERQQWMISEAWHVHRPLPQIIRALAQVGIVIKIKSARNWVTAGKLVPSAVDPMTGQNLFTPADVKAAYDLSRHGTITLLSKIDNVA